MVAKQVRIARRGDSETLYGRLAREMREPGRLPRLLARARSGALDRSLIAGRDPAASRQLAARASRLTSRRQRSAIADALERVLQATQESPSRRRVLPSRSSVLANLPAISGLADLLRAPSPLYAQGVALVSELIADGTGPVFTGDAGDLARRLREARSALLGHRAADAARTPGPGPDRPRELVQLAGPSYKLPDGSWIYRRRDSS
jgi:hypothetical protein